jgi:CHASE3 domain sensor protein
LSALDRGFDVLQRLRQVYISLIDAETGQRGFLLTSRDTYLVPYDRALKRLPTQLSALRSMMADDPAQLRNMDDLQSVIADKLEELGGTIRYAKAGDMTTALKLVKSERGRIAMDKIRLLVRQMRINCDRTLANREEIFTKESRANTRLALILVIANGVFSAIAATLLWRIRRMESLVTICAWSRTIEYQGEWMSFEEYLKLRFDLETTHGISPAESERFRKAVDKTLTPPT